MSCVGQCATIVNDMLYSCDNKPVGGIKQVVKLINRCDIDLGDWIIDRSTGSTCANTIEYSVADPADLNAVKIIGIPGKRLLSTSVASSETDYGTYFTHTVNLFAQGLTASSLCNIQAFANGAEVIAIVEQNLSGTAVNGNFLVYGWDAGLKISDFTHNSNENNGNVILPLSSRDPDLEPYAPLILDQGTYALTKAFFDAL